jgi:hypothetical protein
MFLKARIVALMPIFGLSGCAGLMPTAYSPPRELANAPAEMNDLTTNRRLTVSEPPNSVDTQTPAFNYVDQVRAALDIEGTQIYGAKQGISYAGVPVGIGTAVSAAAKAASGITLGFGAATAALTGLHTASGIDSRAQIISKAQAAIACLQQAETLLATPVVPAKPDPARPLERAQVSDRISSLLGFSAVADASYKIFTQTSGNVVSDAVIDRDDEVAANVAYATGADGRLPWFLVRESWTIWNTTQQQLQNAAGNLSDVLSGVKSAINGQSNNQTTGSSKSVADKSKKASAQAEFASKVAMSAGHSLNQDMSAQALILSSKTPDPGPSAEDLYQKLQDTIAKCPSQSTNASPPPKKGSTT